MNSRRSVFGILLLLCFYIVAVPGIVRGQASLQRGVRISNANGNIITILTGLTPSTYTLLLPSLPNPSTTSASLLYGIGNAALDWTATAGVTSGNILTLQLNGSNLVPTWVDPTTILNGSFWALTGNSITSAYNGTTGNFIGTTNTQPLVIATTNTTTAQDIRLMTGNTERMRINGSGEIGIGVTAAVARLLHVAGTSGVANVRFNSLSGANIATSLASNEGLIIGDANGDLTKRSPSILGGSFVLYDVTTTQNISTVRSDNLFNVSYSGGGNDVNAAGAVITSVGGATNRSATALTLTATGTGSGTATGLNVTASGGTNNYAATFTGSVGIGQTSPTQALELRNGNLLLSNTGTADQLQFQGTSTGITTFQAGAQGATNINYVLPIAAPTVNGQVLSSTTSGTMSWSTPSSGTVTSVGLALPVSVFTVSGSPVTTAGTLTGAFTTQTANTVFAGPSSGVPAVPTFRTLTPSDVNAWGLTGNSGLTAWNGATGNFLGTTDATDVVIGTGATAATREKLRITNSGGNLQITTSGAQLSFKGTSTGLTTFQAGAQGATNINYVLPIAAPSVNGQVLSSTTAGTMSWSTPSSGTVTSVGLALPVSVFSVSGSPVTTSGVLTGAFTTQTANTVFAGPSSGVPAVPTFRTLTPADVNAWGLTGNSGLTAWNGATGNFLGTTDATDVVIGTGATAATREKLRVTNTGNIQIVTSAAQLSFKGTSTGVTTFQAGAQGATNINYTLPIAAPAANTYVLSSSTAGVLSWTDPATLPPNDWHLTGNSGLTAWNGATGNFLGTTDATDVVFGTGVTLATREKVRITNTGNLQLSQPGTQLSFLGTSTGVTTFQAGAQGATNINYTLPIAAPTVSGQVLSSTTAGAMSWTSASAGTVTSVGLALPVSVFTVSGSPVTTSGTLTGAFATQTANTVFAGPSSGVPAVPTFRTLTPSDVNAWGLTGNSGLTAWNGATGNFLGTTDATDVVIGTGATAATREKVRITTTGNLQLSQPGTQLSFLGTSTGVTTFQAGAQGATNINYTLPITAPAVNGYVLSATTAGVMSWINPSAGGSFWGLTGNAATTAWNGTTGNFLGTTDAQPLVIATTFTTTPQPIKFYTNNTERMRIDAAGNVGIGNTPNTGLDITADFATREYNYTTINFNGSYNDLNFDGVGNKTSLVRLSAATGASTFTGIAGGQNGKLLTIYNATTQNISLANQSVASVAANRIVSGTGNTLVIPAGGSANLTYSPTDSRWFVNSINDIATLNNTFWSLSGNSGLTAWNGATGNFVGTTDATDLVFGTGATAATREKVRITTAGNLQLSQPGTQLSFLGTGTGVTTFQAGAQGATNLNYTLPIAAPTVSGQVLSSTTAGVLSWASGGSGTVTGSGTATRIAFWGPGPGVTSNLQDNANLYWDNTNSRISIGAGTTPTATLHALTSGAKIAAISGGLFNNTSTSATNAINKISLDIQSSGSWGSGVASTSNAIGLNVNVTGATNTANNIAALFNGGDVGIGNTQPAVSLDVSNDFATREYNYTTSLAGTINNVDFDGLSNQTSMVRIQTATAPILITGIVGGANGKHLTIYNGSNQSMTIVNQSASSTATNRIITGTIANIPVPSTGSANFIYSAQEQRWVCYAVSGVSGWLYTGNSGLTDNVSNYLGTLDNVPIRFVSGATSAPNTRMLLDINGNLLFGAGAGTTSFASGSGRFAFGDALTTARLNSVPTFGARVFNMIDANAVLRVWRFNSNAGGTDPAVEFVGGTNDNQGNALNSWWDIHVTGTPGVPNSGTVPTGEHMNFRRRTGSSDSEYVSIFSGGNVGIGDDGNKGVPLADVRLNVTHTNGATATVTSLLALNHRSTGIPANGFGSGMLFRAESTTTNEQNMASINSFWTTAADATRTAALTFSTVNNAAALSEAVRIAGNGYVGINTTAPGVSTDINGGYATRVTQATLSNGTNNNVTLGNTSFLRISGPTAAFTITGLAAGVDGQRLTIMNASGQDMTLADSSTLSTLGNRFETNILSDITFKGSNPIVNLIYDATNSGKWMITGSQASQVSGPVGSLQYIAKAADQTITNSAALTNDNDLAFAVNDNETWEITGEIDVRCINATPNVKVAFTVPTGATMKIMYTGIQDAATVVQGNGQLVTSGVASTVTVGANIATLISFRGIVRTTTSAGTVQFKWAQATANANGTTIKVDSYMKALRVK